MVVVKLGQCGGGGGGEAPAVWWLPFVVRRSSFARTIQGYISAHILFFIGAPVVFVNMFRCEIN